MAAPCRRMAASGSLLQVLSRTIRTPALRSGFRQFSGSSRCGAAAVQARLGSERAGSPWTLMAAVCLQRLPVVSAELTSTEHKFKKLMEQLELEKSVLCDHEILLLEDEERQRRKTQNEYDSDDEEAPAAREIVLTQDLEDMWDLKLKNFEPEPRARADVDEDMSSLQRCLKDTLMLLAEQTVAGEKMWLLPHTTWQEGETLRQTAERALTCLPAGFKATFLGNAPCGVYKYKLPKAVRTEGAVGTKVFFFKAVLSERGPPAAANAPFVWVKKSELPRYLKPAYMMKVERFILGL